MENRHERKPLPPSLTERQSVVQTPHYEMVDGKLNITFKPDLPSVRLGGQTFGVDERPCVVVGRKRMTVEEIF